MGLTALTGEPVMCVVIFANVKRQPFQEIGIDVMAPVDGTLDDINDNNLLFIEKV